MYTIADFFGPLTGLEWYGLLAPFGIALMAWAVVGWSRWQNGRSDARDRAAYHAARLRELTVMARHVLGEAEAERWMTMPQPMLGGYRPVAMTWDRESAAKLERLLYAIAQGMPGIAATGAAAPGSDAGNVIPGR